MGRSRTTRPVVCDDREPNAERDIRFQDDMELRAAGYLIVSRPSVGVAYWRLRGEGTAYPQQMILEQIAARAIREKRGEDTFGDE